MKSLFTFLLFTTATLFAPKASAQTANDYLDDVIGSTDLIHAAINESKDAVYDFYTQILMGGATAADATNFRNRIAAAQAIVEEQHDEIVYFIGEAAALNPNIDPNDIIQSAIQIEVLEDVVQNQAEAARIGFDPSNPLAIKIHLKAIFDALKMQHVHLRYIIMDTNRMM